MASKTPILSQQGAEAACVLLLPPGAVVPAVLVRALGRWGLSPLVVADAPAAMIALSQKSRRVVVTIDSDRVRGFIELKAAMQLHYPVAALWRLDQGLQGPQLTAVLQPTTASATEGGSGQETHPSQTRSEALPAHRSSNAASASAAPQAVEMNPERPATVTEAELDMLLGRSEPSPGPTT